MIGYSFGQRFIKIFLIKKIPGQACLPAGRGGMTYRSYYEK